MGHQYYRKMFFIIRSLLEYLLFYCSEKKQKMETKVDKKKRKMLKTAEELHDPETELSSLETGLNKAVTVNRKSKKAEKKPISLTNLDTSTEATTSEITVETNDSEHSAVAPTVGSSHIERRPAKLGRNSGVVRIIEKSRHKRGRRTDNIEEALQLDVGIGSCQW